MNQTKRNSVSADAEWPPFLRDGLGKTEDGGFGRGVVSLTDVAMKTRDGRYINDRAVLSLFRLSLD
jgi:hypothetical protein